MAGRGSKPGERRGGRKRGVPNKLNASVKEAIIAAFNEVGGASYLVTVAAEQPSVFCQLVGKILPLQLANADENDPLRIQLIERVIVRPKNPDG